MNGTNAYKVTVTRKFSLLVGRTEDMASARRFAEELLDSGAISDGDWEQSIGVEPLPAHPPTPVTYA